MRKFGKKALGVLVLALIAAAISSCINVNTPARDNQVKIGGDKGVVVDANAP